MKKKGVGRGRGEGGEGRLYIRTADKNASTTDEALAVVQLRVQQGRAFVFHHGAPCVPPPRERIREEARNKVR